MKSKFGLPLNNNHSIGDTIVLYMLTAEKYCKALSGTMLVALFLFYGTSVVAQGPKVDNNLGTWLNAFNDPLGTNQLQNTAIDAFAGTVQLQSGQNSGSARTVVIDPSSADAWKQVCLTATYSANSNLTIDVLHALDSTVIPGFGGLSMSGANSNGCFDISGINFNTYPRIMVRMNFTRGATAPVVSELKVTWNPVTYVLFDKLAPLEIMAGQNLLYRVRVSANFVNAKDLVIWDPLPTDVNGMTIYEPGEDYGQDDSPSLAIDPTTNLPIITNNGLFTATPITLKGVNIPANSVYWSMDSLPAGQSISMRFLMRTVNGTLDGTKIQNRAYFNVANGADGQSLLKTTTIRSAPSPGIDKKRTLSYTYCPGSGIIATADSNYTREGTTIRFCIRTANSSASEGVERMYNTVLWDNLGDLAPIYATNGLGNPIVSNISGGGQYTATAITVAGKNIPANSIYWNLGTFGPGSVVDQSFSLELKTGGPYLTEHTNTAYVDSDQTSVVQDEVDITMLPSFNSIPGSAGCSKGMPEEVRYKQVFTGGMSYGNSGVGTLRNNVIFDRIPNEMTFVSASFQAGNNYNGQIWYFEDNTGTYTNPVTPPAFDFTNPAATPGVAWTQTAPTDNNLPNESIWVAYFVPAMTSPILNTNINQPISVGANFTGSVIDQGCKDTVFSNTAVFRTYGFTAAGGALTDRNYTQAPLYSSVCGDATRAIPVLPSIGGLGGSNTITPIINETGTAIYNAGFTVSDQGTGLPINNVVATIQLDKTNVNGVLVYPGIIGISGASVTNFNPNTGTLTFNLGTMYNGDQFAVQLSLRIPFGTLDAALYGAQISVTGNHVNCPANATFTDRRSGVVISTEKVQVFKNDVVSLIGSGEQIDYKLSYRGIGPSPSKNTWVADRIPFETTFINATAPLGERVWFTDKLPPFMPANQVSVVDPVDFSTIQANFTPGIVNNMGTPNNYADDIITSPFGTNTTWIAWNVDALGTEVLPVTAQFKEVAFTVKNDLDGTGPNTVGSPSGTVIFNEEVIFSDNLLQAVGNEVRTTILDFPGLFMRKYSDKEIVSAGQPFNWIIEYYNSSDATDDIVRLIDNLPTGVTLNSVSHQWNAKAVANGKPAGLINLSGNANLTTTANADGTTTVDLKVAGSPALLNDLLTEEGGLLYLNVTINSTIPSGSLLINNVRGIGENGSNVTVIDDQDPVSVFNPDLAINKLVDNDMPNNGDVAKFTLVVSNQGLVEAPSVVITDILPVGATYVPGSTSLLTGGYTLSEPTVAGNTLTWNNLTNTALGTPGVVPAQSGEIYITYLVDVSGMSGDVVTNRVNITTPLMEDNNFPNQDSVIATIPFPDPTVLKTGNDLVDPGSAISYTITYRNLDNYDAANVYVLETLPDWNTDGNADVTYISTASPSGVVPYFNATTGAAPAFTPASPTANGWSATPTTPVNHIAYLIGTLAASAGPANIALTVTAAQPITGVLPPAGTQFVNTVRIFTSSPDSDLGNNTDTHTTITPGVDLGITKTGSAEGTFPGLRPGDTIQYTIRVKNTGSQNVYGVRIQDALPAQFVPLTPFTTFATVQAYDATGQVTSLLDPSGANLAAVVPVTQTGTVAGGQTITWALGTTSNTASANHYQNVGLPVGAYVEFVISGQIASNVTDGIQVTNAATAIYDGPVGNVNPELFLPNNTDNSQVTIYQPELFLNKEVLSLNDCSTVTITPNSASPLYVNSGNFGGLNSPALNSTTSWSGTNASSTTQFVGMRWTTPSRIKSVTTKGRGNAAQWVLTYALQATKDGTNWVNIGNFTGNTDQNTSVTRTVSNSNSNWVGLRINPLTWNGFPSLRFAFEIQSPCDTITNEYVEAGDTLLYQLTYNNIGNADADNVTLDEIIPAGTEYIPGSLLLPPGATVEFAPNATNPSSFTVNLGRLPAPATFDGGISLDRTFHLDSTSMEGLDTNMVGRLRYYAMEPPAIGTVGSPVAAPPAPMPAVPAAPQPAIPAAPQPAIPAAPQPAIPAAPQPAIPTSLQPAIPVAPQPAIPAAPSLAGGVTLGACNCATQIAIPQIECEALVALYNSTTGASWTASGTAWGGNNNPTSWGGVTVSGGRVTSINLGNRNLNGTIPSQLGNLIELTVLHLGSNTNLTGPPPAALGNLTKLNYLDLSNTKAINGALPAEWWNMGSAVTTNNNNYRFQNAQVTGTLPASWGNMTKLQNLLLDNNSITGPLPPEWGNMARLQSFYMQRNNVKLNAPLPAEWWNMGSLSTTNDYSFYELGLTGTLPASWGNMTNLRSLQLGNGNASLANANTITGPLPDEWGNMVRLQNLAIDRQNLNTPLPAGWWNMGSLASNNNYSFYEAGITGTLPASWGNMSTLRYLQLSNGNTSLANANKITGPLPDEWGGMVRLEQLSMDRQNLNAPLPAGWWNMGSLASNNNYSFYEAGITGTLPASWGNMSTLRYLQLSNGSSTLANANKITGPLPAEWGNMTGLQNFQIYNNNLNTTLPAEWWKMGSLSPGGVNNDYHFEQAGITGSLPASWGNMGRLRYLYLHNGAVTGTTNNAITGPLPPAWGNMTGLERFFIYNNNLNASLPAEWWNMGSLANNNEYHFEQAGITGALPASWGNMTRLLRLYLHNDATTGSTNNTITGPLPPEWGNMVNIQIFFLYNNNLNDSLPAEWWRMGLNLGINKQLNFTNAGLVGPLPPSWGNLRFYQLFMNNNQLSGPLPPEWGNMRFNTVNVQFEMQNNLLTCHIPESWANIGAAADDGIRLNGNKLIFNGPGTTSSNPVVQAFLNGTWQGGSNYKIQTAPTETEVLQNNCSGAYPRDGVFGTPIIAGAGFTAWDRLFVNQTIPDGAGVTYSLFAGTLTAAGGCTGTPIAGHQNFTVENGIRDISDIAASNTQLCMEAAFASDNTRQFTPVLESWRASYKSSVNPTIQFAVAIDKPLSTGQTQVDNTAVIRTTTSEINPNNNEAEATVYISLTDLAVTKTVDKAAVVDANNELITYTLNYEALGPQEAINPVITDVLPPNTTYQSATPAPATVDNNYQGSGRTALIWNLTPAAMVSGTTGSISVSVQETNAVNGDNLLNNVEIGNDRQETDYDNNSDEALTVVGTLANVYIVKDGPSVVEINGTGQFTLTYGNNGNVAAANVVITDNLPVGFTPTGGTDSNGGTVNVAGQTVTLSLATPLAAGATGTVTISFAVANTPSLVGTVLNNVARITTTTPETNISDNDDNHQTPVELLRLAALSGLVWHDDDRDGVVDPGEYPIPDVTIILTGTDIFGNPVLVSTTTNSEGTYNFPGLNPGTYNVEEVQPTGILSTTNTPGTIAVTNIGDVIKTATPPQTTTPNVGAVGNGINNAANEAFNNITLNPGDRGVQYNFGEDFASLGDTVWVDVNRNGVQDTGEPVLPNITVRLYTDTDMSGTFNPMIDMLKGTTFTNPLGFYEFDQLVAGTYFVVFDSTSFPANHSFTVANAGGDDTNDSDANPATGVSHLITLAAGAHDPTIDLGVAPPCVVLSNPSPAQNFCVGAAGNNITVQADYNTYNIRFVRFATDQMSGAVPTSVEATAIYTGGTVLSTVTTTGVVAPFTATLTAASANFGALAAGTYYVYAILNPDLGSSCRPVQEIVVTIATAPNYPAGPLSLTNTCPVTTVNLTTLNPVDANSTTGTVSYHTSLTGATAPGNTTDVVTNPAASATPGTYYIRKTTPNGCFDYIVVNVAQTACCTAPVLSVQNPSVCLGSLVNLENLVSSNTPPGILSFHNSPSDANAGIQPLVNHVVSPTATTTVYVRSTTGSGSCYTTASITLSAETTPALVVANGEICAGGSVDLATLVTNSGGGTLKYFATRSDADTNTNALINTVVSPVSAKNYYIRSENNSGCFTVKEVIVSLNAPACGVIQVSGPH